MDNFINKIICDDCLTTLSAMPDDFISLTACSPPYNLSIKYGNHQDNMPYDKYLEWLKDIFTQVYRITKSGGRIAINIDSMTNRQDDKDEEYIRAIYPHLYQIMKKIGWKFRTEICWYKQNAVGRKTAWGSYKSPSSPIIRRNHEYVLVWSKDKWKLDGDKSLIDITAEEFQKWTLSTWFISPEIRNMGNHPVPFPTELVRRIVKLFSYKEDIVLDPFNGSGTTTYVSNLLKRKFIGIDVNPEYCKFARDRIASSKDLFENE